MQENEKPTKVVHRHYHLLNLGNAVEAICCLIFLLCIFGGGDEVMQVFEWLLT